MELELVTCKNVALILDYISESRGQKSFRNDSWNLDSVLEGEIRFTGFISSQYIDMYYNNIIFQNSQKKIIIIFYILLQP